MRIEAGSLRDKLLELETAFFVEFWWSILHKMNKTSKSVQDPTIDVEILISLFKSLHKFYEKI